MMRSRDFAIARIDGPSLEGGATCIVLRRDGLPAPAEPLQVAAWRAACAAVGIDPLHDLPPAPTDDDLMAATAERLLARLHDREPQAVWPSRVADGARCLSAAEEPIARRVARIAITLVDGAFGRAAPPSPDAVAGEITALRRAIPDLPENGDTVSPLIVAAARGLGVPCRRSRIQPESHLLGEGRCQVRFDRSAPLSAPALGVVVSPGKLATKRFLVGLGIPVLAARLPTDADDAARHAAELGFPVAIKPVDGTFARGVSLDVRTPDAARAAFACAADGGAGVMIEPYLDTPDFRATVIGGRVAIVMRRNPPHVAGDGRRTIGELIAAHNAALAAGTAAFPAAVPVAVDDEVRETLAKAGRTLDSVPAAGARVVVRTLPIRALGGYPTEVTAETHPGTLRLFERVARVLAMPVAAIDFRAEAIERPWQEQRMAVLEVNARPGIGDLHGDRIARRLVALHFPDPAATRLPTVLVVDPQADTSAAAVSTALTGVRGLGLAGLSGVVLDGFPAGAAPASVGAAHDRIVEDSTIAVALHWTTADRIARRGLGIPRIDHAFLPAGMVGAVADLVRRHADRVDPLPQGADGDRIAAVAAIVSALGSKA